MVVGNGEVGRLPKLQALGCGEKGTRTHGEGPPPCSEVWGGKGILGLHRLMGVLHNNNNMQPPHQGNHRGKSRLLILQQHGEGLSEEKSPTVTRNRLLCRSVEIQPVAHQCPGTSLNVSCRRSVLLALPPPMSSPQMFRLGKGTTN